MRYRPWTDPVCIGAMAVYAVNRWLLLPRVGPGPWRAHFSDLWCLPAALPWVLWLHDRLGWRPAGTAPRRSEVAFHLVVWSVVAEGIAPRWPGWGTADPMDAAAYAIGALVAGLWWHLGPWNRPTVPARP